MKKILVSLLCVAMMVTFMPSMAFADSIAITESSTTELQNDSNGGTMMLHKSVKISIRLCKRLLMLSQMGLKQKFCY